MIATNKTQLTLDEFLKLPETKPASEYLDSGITQKPIPQGEHSLIQTTFCELVNGITKSQKIALAFPELRCSFGGASIVPDVAVFRWDKIPKTALGRIANRFEIHPDWVIEILSPDQQQKKVLANLLHCSKNRTEISYLINPEEESIIVIFPGQKIELYEGNKILPILTSIELQLTPNQIFGWLNFN